MNTNIVISPDKKVKKVLIWKCESEYSNDYLQLECHLIFDDDSEIQYIIGQKWDSTIDGYLTCELEDDAYSRGIYEYKDGKYIQIEDWDN